MRRVILIRSLFLAVLVGCGAGCIGFYFAPGFSMRDRDKFMESPHIVVRTNAYSLRWRYGEDGWFFQPRSKVVDGELLFSLQATSSSGALTGRYGELPITGAENIRALETGGAYWIERGGPKTRLEVRRL